MSIEITIGGRTLIAAKCAICRSIFWPASLLDAHMPWHETLYSRSNKWFPAADMARHRPKKGGRKKMKDSEKAQPKANIDQRRKKGK